MKKIKDDTKRKLVQVTMQIWDDQAEQLEALSTKEISKQSLVREALDARGICDIKRLS